jgi:3',5'-cyclic AMP phosphodiesterase CpdA
VRTIAHISDVHFGRADPLVVEGLLSDLAELQPSLVVVSGDLTQRARRRQFAAARAFLGRIEAPLLAVPGNHDIPLFDLPRRILSPFGRYRAAICSELEPLFRDDELAVLGLNSSRPYVWRSGRLSPAQAADVRRRLASLPPEAFRVVVTHHPFLPPPHGADGQGIAGGLRALRAAQDAGVDLLLAGHLHLSYSADVRSHHRPLRRSMLSVQAGTLSTRTRTEVNGYNWVVVDPPRLTLAVRAWTGSSFAPTGAARYVKRHDEWEVQD